MEISKTEGKRILRSLELKAYRSVVDALRAQGTLTKNKHEVLKNLAAALKVDEERSRSEMRRAVNNNLLTSVAQCTSEEHTDRTWRTESVQKVPPVAMLAPQTVFTALADNISDIVALHNKQLPEPSSSLNDLLKACTARTEDNLARYHSSKMYEPLLSTKTFKEDAIRSQLEKIKLKNKYSHPNEYLYRVSEKRVPSTPVRPDPASTTFQPRTVYRNEFNPCMAPCSESDTAEFPTSATDSAAHNPTGAQPVIVKRLRRPKLTVQPEERPASNAASRARRARLLGKRWNPRTHALEMLVPNASNTQQGPSRSKALEGRKGSNNRNRKRGHKAVADETIEQLAVEPAVEANEQVTSPSRRPRRIRRPPWSRTKTQKTSKVDPQQSKSEAAVETNMPTKHSPNNVTDKNVCASTATLPDNVSSSIESLPSTVDSTVNTHQLSNDTSPVKLPNSSLGVPMAAPLLNHIAPVQPSNSILEVPAKSHIPNHTAKPQRSNHETEKMVQPSNPKSQPPIVGTVKPQLSNHVDKTVCPLKPKLPDHIANLPENRHSHRRKSETVEVIDVDLSDGEEPIVRSRSDTVELARVPATNPSVSALEITHEDELPSAPLPRLSNVDDMRPPHTFNLIPASRRLKILKKRPLSPSADIDAPVKKFVGQSIADKSQSLTNDICSAVRGASPTNKSKAGDDLDGAANVVVNDTASQHSDLPRPKEAGRTIAPVSDLVAKISMLGNIRVRAVGAFKENSLAEVHDPSVKRNTIVVKKATDGGSEKMKVVADTNRQLIEVSEQLIDIESADVIIGDPDVSEVGMSQDATTKNAPDAVPKTIKMNNESTTVSAASQEDSSSAVASAGTEQNKGSVLIKRVKSVFPRTESKPNFVIFNVSKKSLKPVTDIISSMKLTNAVGDSLKPRVKVLNAKDFPNASKDSITVEMIDQMLASSRASSAEPLDPSVVIANDDSSSATNMATNSIIPSLKTGPKYRKPLRSNTIGRATIIEPTASAKARSITIVDPLSISSSSKSLLKSMKIVSPVVQQHRNKLTLEIEETIKSMIEPSESPKPAKKPTVKYVVPAPVRAVRKEPTNAVSKTSLATVRTTERTSQTSKLLPPIRTEVYELYDLLGTKKKDESGQPMVTSDAQQTSVSAASLDGGASIEHAETLEKVNSAMIEISSLEENTVTEVKDGAKEVDPANVITISDIGSPSCDDSYRFLYEYMDDDENVETVS